MRESPPRDVAAWHDLLDPVERGRWAAYREPVDRARFLTGVALTRQVLAEHLGVAAAEAPLDRACARCGAPHGVPRVVGRPDLRLSVAHAGDLVLVALADRAVGVDVEPLGPGALEVEGQVLTDAERRVLAGTTGAAREVALVETWVRKEAVLKMLGTGLRTPMVEVDLSAHAVVDLHVGPAHRAALATAGPPAVDTGRRP